jgi:hypothetical protein
MEMLFARSEEAHEQSMAEISKALTVPLAMEELSNSSVANSRQLVQLKNWVAGKQDKDTFLKRTGRGPGAAAAKKLLNEMIYESMAKYDSETAKCTEYYAQQCAEMEVARGLIAAANFVSANSRALVLDAQAVISKNEKAIIAAKEELRVHRAMCKKELSIMKKNLKSMMDDIAVMTVILKKSDCEAKQFLETNQLAVMLCEDPCGGDGVVTFNNTGLQHQVSQLQASSQILLRTVLEDMFVSNASADPLELVQVDYANLPGDIDSTSGSVELLGSKVLAANVAAAAAEEEADDDADDSEDKPKKKKKYRKQKYRKGKEKKKKIKINRPPVPQAKVAGNPCRSKNGGAPAIAVKRESKCTLNKSPMCYKLQQRFMLIQSGIEDAQDDLMSQIDSLEKSCKETESTITTKIENDEALLASYQTKLAAATEKESSAGEESRQTAKEKDQLDSDLRKQMKVCTANYLQYETEICSLKKIRGELAIKGDKNKPAFFQDCQVSKWTPEACSKKCAGGEQKLTRTVLTHPTGGAKCLPLAAKTSCNNMPCPVNCVLKSWSGWTKCSSDCGGGVTQRLRDVKVMMRYGGKPCGTTSESKSCNIQACEANCVMTKWTKWSTCSKDCDGGTQKRQRYVKTPALGSGTCPSQWSKDRLQYSPCNVKRCKTKGGNPPRCKPKLDVIFMIDRNPSTGQKTFDAQIKAAKTLISRFHKKTNVAIISYGGPRTWSGVSRCTGKTDKKVNTETMCHIKVHQHFTSEKSKATAALSGITAARGSKLLSLGLQTAKAELALGSKRNRAVTIVFNDGRPLSFRRTALSAKVLRKASRLHWITVGELGAKAYVKPWATRRWQENIVNVKSGSDLSSIATLTHVIANICPHRPQRMKLKMKKR